MSRFVACAITGLALLVCPPIHAQVTALGFEGTTASLYSNGVWTITVPGPQWTFTGNLGSDAIAPHLNTGEDALGSYEEIAFTYSAGPSFRTASIRMYQSRATTAFSVTFENDSTNVSPFPVISSYPSSLSHLSFNGEFSPPDFVDLIPNSPWAWFDPAGNTFILSPASDFMTATTSRRSDNTIAAGISEKITALPAGFTHKTLLVFGRGINRTFETWGSALTTLGGKRRAANDSEALLKSVSYWTDNGATYYYNPGGASYSDTLNSVKNEFDSKGIRLGSLQLDSWWYPKGPDDSWSSHSGIWTYTASPALFQPDLAGFQSGLRTPLVTHARWIDANSPYRTQYKISGNVAIDPAYWEEVATYLQSSGVTTYEQDWLGANAHANFNLTDPDAFLGDMAAAMARHGITIQYCMAEPTHFLQSVNYSNVTTIRASQDRFRREIWTNFFYSSRFASALGLWPFTDVLMSTETNNLIAATLSAGPVGVGDAIGNLSRSNLLKAVRSDGVIVKPDVPATPVESVIQKDALGIDTPMLASTYSDFGRGLRTYYLFAYVRGANRTVTVDPKAFGMSGAAYLYDSLNDTGRFIDQNSTCTFDLPGDTGYYILAPVQSSGIALLGDRNNFVSLGKKRIPRLTDHGQMDVTISFAAGERTRTLFGYSAQPVDAVALTGRYGGLTWDPSTQIFTVNVHPVTGVAHLRFMLQGTLIKVGGCPLNCSTPVGPVQDQ
jgi:hypothetical protein